MAIHMAMLHTIDYSPHYYSMTPSAVGGILALR